MDPLLSDITSALAPGIALTSVIFYNTSLQNRFVYISSRIRDLNREARDLAERGTPRAAARLRSVREQVTLFTQRSLAIRQCILIVYGAFFCFILTILMLLISHGKADSFLGFLPLTIFGLGLCALACAIVISIREMSLSHQTLLKDIAGSFEKESG
jgi:hypothetical protein